MIEKLSAISVFSGIQAEELRLLLNDTHYQMRSYQQGTCLACAGDLCVGLYVLLDGQTKGEMVDETGKRITIEEHQAPVALAPAFVFGDQHYFPVDVYVVKQAKVMIIQRIDFIRMMQRNSKLLENYMNMISNKAQFLSGKIRFLNLKSLKSKIAEYILNLSQDRLKIIELGKGQQALADLFGVARPSFARALGEMEEQGLIRYKNRSIEIVDKEKLSKEAQ